MAAKSKRRARPAAGTAVDEVVVRPEGTTVEGEEVPLGVDGASENGGRKSTTRRGRSAARTQPKKETRTASKSTTAKPSSRQTPPPPLPLAEVEQLRHEAGQVSQQVRAVRQRSAALDSEMQEIEQLVRGERSQCAELGGHLAEARETLRQSGMQLEEATQRFVGTAELQIQQVTTQLQSARTEAEQTENELRGLRDSTGQAVATVRLEITDLRQRLEEAERELAELKQRSAAGRSEAEKFEEEARVTHRMLRRARDEAREVSAEVPIPQASPPETPPVERPVHAAVATEGGRERLLRYLNDAWSVETTLLDTLQKMADEVEDPQLKALFVEHRATTARQQEALGVRLRELNREPSGGKGFFNRLVGGIWEGLHRPGDDLDRTAQDLMKSYATEHFEVAMYQALDACATAVGDGTTAELARRHQAQEREAAEKVWFLIAPTLALAAESHPV